MTPAEYKPGLRVWYEPSAGVRFLGETVDEAPRQLGGQTWVTTVAMSSRAYGVWRRGGDRGEIRMSVPAASLDHLFVDDPPPTELRTRLALAEAGLGAVLRGVASGWRIEDRLRIYDAIAKGLGGTYISHGLTGEFVLPEMAAAALCAGNHADPVGG
jgi:hypothetical protein